MSKKKSLKKRAKKALITATAATSLFVNNAYDNPLDIIDDLYGDGNIEELDEENQKTNMKSSFRKYLGKIPLPIRLCVLVPLWVIGWALMRVIEPIMSYIILPNLSFILDWVIALVLVLSIIFIAVTIIFPNLPLGKIFNKKTIRIVTALVIALAITDKVLEIFNSDYAHFKFYLKFGGCVCITIFTIIYIYFKNRKIKIKVSTDKYSFSGE